jgi:hypothetical protein
VSEGSLPHPSPLPEGEGWGEVISKIVFGSVSPNGSYLYRHPGQSPLPPGEG